MEDPKPYNPKKCPRFPAFTSRLKQVTGCSTVSELSEYFEVSHSTIRAWLRKGKLSLSADSSLRVRGINPDWVRTGKGKRGLALPVCTHDYDLNLACPLRIHLRRLITICDHCGAWAAIAGQSPGPQ